MVHFMAGIKKYVSLIIIYAFRLFPIKNNRIFMFSYYGSQYGCNPKYITEYILGNFAPDKFEIVWAFNDLKQKEHLHGFRKVKTMSLRYFYDLCTAKVIITNFRTTELFVKRKNQYYIQTWHSSLRLKQIEKDAEDSLEKHYVHMAKQDSLKCDLLLSGCEYSTSIFKRAFWYDGEIFERGIPRNDILFHENARLQQEIRTKLGIDDRLKVVLYAPTFRKNNRLDVYDLDYGKMARSLEGKFGGEWTVLLRLHPHLMAHSSRLALNNKVMDVTSYDDIQELLCIADVLVTDYSSLMFDYSITGRPCFLYVPDAADYVSKDRKLYFEFSELPFAAAFSQDDFYRQVEAFNNLDYAMKQSGFLSRIGSYEDGTACENLLRRIYEVCFNEKRREVYEAV